MPATVINVTAVENSTVQVLKQITAQEDALAGIDRIVNSMEGVWESEAQQAYAESFRATKQRIQGFNLSMIDSVSNIRSFVNDCVLADEQTARELRNVRW